VAASDPRRSRDRDDELRKSNASIFKGEYGIVRLPEKAGLGRKNTACGKLSAVGCSLLVEFFSGQTSVPARLTGLPEFNTASRAGM
jgi:hypothetical protein